MKNPLSLQQIKNPIIRYIVQKISKIDVLEEWYDGWLKKTPTQPGPVDGFLKYLLDRSKIKFNIINEDALTSIPTKDPVIIVANHPLGGLEGLLLTLSLIHI